jgi:hypothetical protein
VGAARLAGNQRALQWGLFRLAGNARLALLSTCLKTESEESQMKRRRAPYASRSVWIAIAVISIVLVAGGLVAGLEISHLKNQVNGLQYVVGQLYQKSVSSGK